MPDIAETGLRSLEIANEREEAEAILIVAHKEGVNPVTAD